MPLFGHRFGAVSAERGIGVRLSFGQPRTPAHTPGGSPVVDRLAEPGAVRAFPNVVQSSRPQGGSVGAPVGFAVCLLQSMLLRLS